MKGAVLLGAQSCDMVCGNDELDAVNDGCHHQRSSDAIAIACGMMMR